MNRKGFLGQVGFRPLSAESKAGKSFSNPTQCLLLCVVVARDVCICTSPSESVLCLALSYSAPQTSISMRGQTIPRPCLGRWRAPKTLKHTSVQFPSLAAWSPSHDQLVSKTCCHPMVIFCESYAIKIPKPQVCSFIFLQVL